MKVIATYVKEHKPETADPELETIIQQALNMTLEDFICRVVEKLQKSIGGRPVRDICIRCYKTKKEKQGFAMKTAHGSLPDIILGFTGNIEDFEITLLHELLHVTR